jgi:CubicO group peptidase (beta-lactamase class C family)
MTSACIGIAIDQGFIKSADQSIFDYLPDHQHLNTDGKDAITIEHLLTMTSGLDWDEWGTYYSDSDNDVIRLWFDCDEQVACILEKPLVGEPGTHFTYSGGNTILLGEIIRNATQMDIEEFSGKYLFQPLGIDPPKWVRFDSGAIYAGGDQNLTPRDMVKFGVTYLDRGVWNGQQIIAEGWVEKSATPYPGPESSWLNHSLRPIPPGDNTWGQRGYSYTWWTHEYSRSGQKYAAFFALGFGGQKISVFPDQDTVVVFTAGNYGSADTSANILTKYVIPAFE